MSKNITLPDKIVRSQRPCKVCTFSTMECGDMGYDTYECNYCGYKLTNWEMYNKCSNCNRNLTDEEIEGLY